MQLPNNVMKDAIAAKMAASSPPDDETPQNTDMDNDGVNDSADTDMDNDGVNDSADTDMDNDGVNDAGDAGVDSTSSASGSDKSGGGVGNAIKDAAANQLKDATGVDVNKLKDAVDNPLKTIKDQVMNGGEGGNGDDNKLLTTGNRDLDNAVEKTGKAAKQVATKTMNPMLQSVITNVVQQAIWAKIWSTIVNIWLGICHYVSMVASYIASLAMGVWHFVTAAAAVAVATVKTAFIAAPVLTTVILAPGLAIGGAGVVAAGVTMHNYYEQERLKKLEEETCGAESDSSTSSKTEQASDAASAAAGDWTTPGTESYTVAQTLFKVLTEDYGLSGTSAAGWLGNVQAESGFSVSAVEAENGQDYSGRGYGLFQFTPGTKYLTSTYYKEGASLEDEVKNQVAFVFASEFENGAYKSYLSNASAWFGLSGVDSIDDVLDNDSIEDAMLIFFSIYERGSIPDMHPERRLEAANKANELFNKDKIKADKSKWKVDTSSAVTGEAGTSTSKKSSDDEDDPCASSGSSSKKSSGELGQASSKDVQAALEKLKADVDAGRTLGSGECYGLTSMYIYYLSGNNILGGVSSGTTLTAVGDTFNASGIGTGWDFASAGYSVKTNPTTDDIQVGDIVNTIEGTNGHTVVIADVLGDGTFLIYEQNYAGKRYALANKRAITVPIASIVRYNGK